ncbi:chemotaxis protein CheW [Bacillus dakarensis]|uniref:chemotaxis protein CheW n=1 Tax=Robertmurraya dakarensis TaxID=1926278 RepID=UPI000980D697|nr:chemotaxis protein CheW [Bacillus dakarensis]
MPDSNKVIVFKVGDEEYAISIEFVLSIEKMERITPIPHLPQYVKGIVKIRGDLVPTMDLEKILYDRSMEEKESIRMIVLQTEVMSYGILVNEAKEIIDVPSDKIKQLGLAGYHKTSYFTGVANIETRLITMIDPSLLVQSLEGIKEIQEYMKTRVQE